MDTVCKPQESARAAAEPELTGRFPKSGFDVYVDHDGHGLRYFQRDPSGKLEELQQAQVLSLVRKRLQVQDPTGPVVGVFLLLALVAFLVGLPLLGVGVGVLALVAVMPLTQHASASQRIRLFYDSERPALKHRFAALDAFRRTLATSKRCWIVQGLDQAPLQPASRRVEIAPAVPHASSAYREVLLAPEGILAWRGDDLTFTDYAALKGNSTTFEQVMEHAPPIDSPRVRSTWKHVNKNGSPDRRRKDNPQLPVVRMGRMDCAAGEFQLGLVTSHPEAALEAARHLQRLVMLARGVAPEVLDRPAAPPQPRPKATRAVAEHRPQPAAQSQASTPPQAPAHRAPEAPKTIPVPAAPAAAPPRGKSSASATWIPPGTPVTVAGYSIPGGMLYVGSGLDTEGEVEPSLLDPSLPIDRLNPNRTDVGLPYWPSYAGIGPRERAGYVEWLAGGRSNPNAPVGYMFLFFYGLERRVLVDGAQDPSSRQEWPRIAEEVERLRKVYGDRQYLSGLLEVLNLGRDLDSALPFTPRCGPPLALRVALGLHAREARPLQAEPAFAWALSEWGCRLNDRAMRAADLLTVLFALRYQQNFGSGIVPKASGRRPITYRGASAALQAVSLRAFVGDLPDVEGDTGPLEQLRKLLYECAEELDPFTRYLGRRPDGRHEAAALALLPKELLPAAEGPRMKQLRVFLKTRLEEEDRAAIPLADLLEHWPVRTPGKVEKAEALALAQYLQKADIGMEPDVRFGSSPSSFQKHTVAFRLPPGSPSVPSDAYNAANLLLQCAATVAAADGSIAPEEEEHLVRHLETALDLTAGERERLHARLRLLLLQPPSVTGLKKQLQALDAAQRLALSEFLILTATADGRIEPAEVKALTRLFEILELDSGTLYSRLHQVSASAGAPAPAVRTPPAQGEGLRLDTSLLELRMAETHQLSSLLATVFTDDEAPPPPPPVAAETVSAVADLDAAHSRLFHRLVARSEWERSSFEEMAGELGLMPDGALDRLNEAALDLCGDPLCDGEDPILVDLQVAKEMNGEH